MNMPDALGVAPEDANIPSGNWSYEQFAYELRYDLLPAVESAYATFAKGDVSEQGLIATREHRALAGLSMGSMHTINAGLMRSLDLFSWFGSFSGAKTEASAISAALHSAEQEPYEIDYLLVTNGRFDMSYEEHLATMRELEANDSKLHDGENFQIIEVKNARHSWANWEVALYDFLQIVFSK